MSKSDELRELRARLTPLWALNLTQESPLSLREFAALHNVAVSTASNWFSETKPGPVLEQDVETVSQELQKLLLRQARTILENIKATDAQAQQQAAAAADKLIANALKLGGLNSPAGDSPRAAGVPDDVSESELDILLGF